MKLSWDRCVVSSVSPFVFAVLQNGMTICGVVLTDDSIIHKFRFAPIISQKFKFMSQCKTTDWNFSKMPVFADSY